MTLEILRYGFMQRALIAAVLIGLAAPSVGVFLVQRRLSLIGDGLGHVALTGVAIGLVTATSPVQTALVAVVVGSIVVELIRVGGRASGDVALAVLFYGGIAGGVVIVSRAPAGTPINLDAYLFGSLTTTTRADVITFAILALVIVGSTRLLRRHLFAVSNDEEHARASGLPVLGLNLLMAVITSVTVVVSMRVVGLLLISALMVIPVATAQLVTGSFASTVRLATAIGLAASVSGTIGAYHWDTPSGGTIVLLAIGAFVVVSIAAAVRDRRRRPV